jgi:hypothetical protein
MLDLIRASWEIGDEILSATGQGAMPSAITRNSNDGVKCRRGAGRNCAFSCTLQSVIADRFPQ